MDDLTPQEAFEMALEQSENSSDKSLEDLLSEIRLLSDGLANKELQNDGRIVGRTLVTIISLCLSALKENAKARVTKYTSEKLGHKGGRNWYGEL